MRRNAAVFLGFLLLVFGLEVSFVNIYALVRSWLSPSATLETLTVVILGILNGVVPIITDSVLLTHIVIESIEHSKSLLRLTLTMATPVFLKVGRLVNAATYIAACAEFVLSSVTSGDGVPDMDALDAAQARSMGIACTLQMARALRYQLVMHHLNTLERRRKALQAHARSPAATSTTPEGSAALLLASGGNFLLPILLSAAQLAASRRWPDSDMAQDLDRLKVVVNVAGAVMTTLVAVLKRWRVARMAAPVVAPARANAEATETTRLLAKRTGSDSKTSRGRAVARKHVMFDGGLFDINMKGYEEMAISLPVV
ncbi:hypothetical protein F5148DRAFT_1283345 [Russula earlei]|uniref:Uncharacterized protein n=1 Tax=Russula earlei TaxID=71964 RepID=A0ACC0UDH6_9AGAM|nr:hypothetical protein F5148DRAFT_1283345 [Russula earlei]